jgi:hypothetical protein
VRAKGRALWSKLHPNGLDFSSPGESASRSDVRVVRRRRAVCPVACEVVDGQGLFRRATVGLVLALSLAGCKPGSVPSISAPSPDFGEVTSPAVSSPAPPPASSPADGSQPEATPATPSTGSGRGLKVVHAPRHVFDDATPRPASAMSVKPQAARCQTRRARRAPSTRPSTSPTSEQQSALPDIRRPSAHPQPTPTIGGG